MISKQTPEQPFQHLAVDYASYGGQQFLRLIVVVDWKTNWPPLSFPANKLMNLFKLDKPTHICIRLLSFFGATTIEAHHSVGSVTGVIIPWSTRRSMEVYFLL